MVMMISYVWPSRVDFSCDLLVWPSRVAFSCGLLVWPSRVAFSCDLLVWPSRVAFSCDLLVCFGHISYPAWKHLARRGSKRVWPGLVPLHLSYATFQSIILASSVHSISFVRPGIITLMHLSFIFLNLLMSDLLGIEHAHLNVVRNRLHLKVFWSLLANPDPYV